MKEFAIFYLDHVGFQKIATINAYDEEEAIKKFRKGSRQRSVATIVTVLERNW